MGILAAPETLIGAAMPFAEARHGASWFRPGDLPEPLDISHFPPIIKALSSNVVR